MAGVNKAIDRRRQKEKIDERRRQNINELELMWKNR